MAEIKEVKAEKTPVGSGYPGRRGVILRAAKSYIPYHPARKRCGWK